MDAIIYNIPLSPLDDYRGRSLILRSADAGELADALRRLDQQDVVSLQILSLPNDPDPPIEDLSGIPVDLVLTNVERDYPNLYHWSGLPEAGPARVTIPVVPGFGKAVKLAVSLGFAVKLDLGQPDGASIGEMRQVLDHYLHSPGISQPIEFFHSMLLAFYHDQPASLWAIQEENPAEYRYVTNEGIETIGKRFAKERATGDLETFPERFRAGLLKKGVECTDCPHFDRCGGYFKWPDAAYRCDGMRSILDEIRNAADELKKDVAAIARGGETPDT